jgi:hypothetical protein
VTRTRRPVQKFPSRDRRATRTARG